MDDKKRQLTLSARSVFLEQGYASTSMEDVAKKSNMGKASIYHYFPSKEDLFNEVITFEIEDMETELLAELKKHKAAEDKLFAYLTVKFDRIRRYHQSNLPFHLWKELGDHYHTVIMRFGQKEAEILASVFVGGMTTGEFTQMDPLKLSAMMMTYFWGMQYSVYRKSCIDGFTRPDLDVAEENSKLFATVLLNGIKTSPKK